MRPFRLAEAVRVCVTDRGSVFLDVERDAYTGIDADQSRGLASLVDGWPGDTVPAEASTEARSLAEDLCGIGLLVASPGGRPVHASTLPIATEELLSWAEMRPPRIRLSHLLVFFRAFFLALLLLHLRPFSASVRHLSRRRSAAPFDLSLSRELLSVYTYVRMFVFARRGRCLLDSMVLAEFLASYRVFPQWVIGVQVRPFSAHSWIQHEHRVLNGTAGFVRTYRPLLVI
jgi:hypothetical protein